MADARTNDVCATLVQLNWCPKIMYGNILQKICNLHDGSYFVWCKVATLLSSENSP
jgi:hypothetical protein